MRVNKFNQEGYSDPTAYEALMSIETKAGRAARKPLVFICSPFAGDVGRNVSRAREYSRFAVSRNVIPIAPHLLFPQFMDDNDIKQRDAAILMGLALMGRCKEVWIFGNTVSKGMAIEIKHAKRRNIPIRYFTDQCKEVLSC